MDVLRLALDLVGAALRAGADHAEACVESGRESRVNWHGGRFSASDGDRTEVSLRVWCDGRYHVLSGDHVDPADAAVLAVQRAKAAGVARQPLLRKGVLDTRTAAGPSSPPIGRALLTRLAAEVAEHVPWQLTAGYTAAHLTRALANSAGLACAHPDETHRLWAWLEGEAGHVRASATARTADGLGSTVVAADLVARAAVLDNAGTSPPPGPCSVVLPPIASADVARSLGVMLSAEHVLGDLKPLRDRVGTRIASRAVTLVDDGTLSGGVRTRPFDDEGTPTQTSTLVHEGRLVGFLHSLHTAEQLGTAPNGKAFRSGLSRLPRPAPSNIHLAAGTATAAEIRAGLRSGLVVAGFSRPGRVVSGTGRFLARAYGHWHEPGAAPVPVRDVPLSAGVFRLLRTIRACGDDVEFSPLADGAGAPTLLIDEVEVG